MLELLSEGASARVLAKKLGYSEGTMRVYLHNLYRVIGVRNKTQAVIWHLARVKASEAPASVAPPPEIHSGAVLGDMALGEDLYTALGAMGSFLGPYGPMWEVGLRLKGAPLDENSNARRNRSRGLWRALLKGDFAHGKALHDDGTAERLAVDAPSEAVLLDCLLLIGGYTGAAEKLMARLADKRQGAARMSAREASLLRALHGALDMNDGAGLSGLHALAAEGARAPAVRQLAMVALYYAYKARRDLDRARSVAGALWAEAESVRHELEAMGVRPLGRDLSLPRAAKPGARQAIPAREKAAVTR